MKQYLAHIALVVKDYNEAIRDSRLADALAWMAEGKIRNWKYVK